MSKDEKKILKEMKSKQKALNRTIDRITSDLCLMKIEIQHMDHDIIAMEQNSDDDTAEHRDRNNSTLENGDHVRILIGTTKAKKILGEYF